MMLNLLENPFVVLNVNIRSTRDEISRAAEDAVLSHRLSEDAARAAQRVLLASKLRLTAEVSWLPELSPARAVEVLERLATDTFENGLLELDGLARANIASHLCTTRNDEELIWDLLDAQDNFALNEILKEINSSRSVAGFPAVTEELLGEALDALRTLHVESALHALLGAEHPGRALTGLVEDFLGSSEIADEILYVIVDKYEAWAASKLSVIQERIDATLADLEAAPNEATIAKLNTLLTEWDEYRQPIQLIHESKGLDDPRSRELYGRVRSVCLELANEKDEFEKALQISQTLAQIFPELPLVADQLTNDLETLKELAKQQANERALEDLATVVQKIREKPQAFSKSLGKGDFGRGDAGTPAGCLCFEFMAAVRATADTDVSETPWMMVRSVAISLHNEHDLTASALELLGCLLSVRTEPPIAQTMKDLLEKDVDLLQQQEHSIALANALSRKDWQDALHLIEKLIKLPAEGDSHNQLFQLRQQLKERIRETKSKRVVAAIGVLLLIGILAAALVSENTTLPRVTNEAALQRDHRNIPPGNTGDRNAGSLPAQIPQPQSSHGSAAADVHTVQSGEWLSMIARRYGVSLVALMEANPEITAPDHIYSGQQIRIPTKLAQSGSVRAPTAVPPVPVQPVAPTPPSPSTAPANVDYDVLIANAEKITELPERYRPVTTEIQNSARVPLPLPPNGIIKRYDARAAEARLTVVTRGTENYYIRLRDWFTGRLVMTVFVRGGSSVDIDMPFGSYQMKYASGKTWCGEDNNFVFGPETRFAVADSRFDFQDLGDSVTWITVELYLQSDGNLETEPISATEF